MTEEKTDEPAVPNRTADESGRPDVLPLTPEPVRLVASARFFTEAIDVPPGIMPRDLPGFLEGEVEDRSLFPLESTAWGYLDGARKGVASQVLLYAAFREQVNGASDPDYARRYAVLPGFAVLSGRSWRRPTWVCLLETECVTLVRMMPRAAMPDYVRSLYGEALEEHPDRAWALRDELLAEAPTDEGDRVEEGLVRCGTPVIDRRGAVRFPLDRQPQPEAAWKGFGQGRIVRETILLAADVRDARFLADERRRRRAVRQLRRFTRAAVVLFVLLGLFQFLYLKRNAEADDLEEQAKAQRPTVKALQEQEALAQSVARFSDPPLEIFDWLSVVNDVRPDSVWFSTAYADRGGRLGFSGEAPSVAVVNKYREALEKTERVSSLDVKELNSAKDGVRFTIQVDVKPAEKAEEETS